ncbi:MAG: PAS domain S-box protein [Rhodocyclaceae bacterium]|nr:PAS domain S-box protein [Rhodocyclaceae bacterium]MBX3669949.1 PAS domain S-box protein [Rhodocyclaceae bacterium]
MIPKPTLRRLSTRIALTTALVGASVIFTIGLGAWWATTQFEKTAFLAMLRKDAEFQSNSVALRLSSLADRMHSVAQGNLLANALVDSAGKESYLLPFMATLRSVDGLAIQVLFTDFAGETIADNGRSHFSDEQIAWLKGHLGSGKPGAAVFDTEGRRELMVAEMILSPRASAPEGALAYKFDLADLSAASGARLVLADDASGDELRVAVAAPERIREVGLAVEVDPDEAAQPLGAGTMALIYGVACLLLSAVLYLLSRRLGRYLTEDLRALESFAALVMREGFGARRLRLDRPGESAAVAAAINLMLDRLNELHAQLQRDSEERFRLVVESVRDYAIYMLDPQGIVVSWNRGAERIKGYAADEVLGRHYSLFYPPEDIAAGLPERHLARAAYAGHCEEEGWQVRKDGQRILAAMVITSLRDRSGRLIGFAKVTRDVTERRRAEAALRDSEAHLRTVLDSVVDAIIVIDMHGTIESANATTESLFGYKPEEVLGRKVNLLMGVQYAHRHDEFLRNYLNTGTRRVIGMARDVSARRKDGSEFPIELSVGELRLAGTRKFIGIVRDITDRKRAEQELRQHRDHLRDLVEERTHELLRAKDAAESADRAKSEFLANMSHELRTPMHAILAFAGLGVQKSQTASIPPDKLLQYFERIRDSGKRLMLLLDDLLDLSKLEAGHMQFYIQPAAVRPLIDEIYAELAPVLRERRQRVLVEGDAGVPLANMDYARTGQVLRNLLGNASKFAPHGSLIAISYTTREDHVEICVSDEGIGIPPDELESIFDKFVQSSKTRSGAGGTGLGLAISKQIVEAQGGRIWAANNPERGARFCFTLQIGATAGSMVAARTASTPATSGSGDKV